MGEAKTTVNIPIALGEPLMHIKQLIPLLEIRNKYAYSYLSKETDEERLVLNDLIQDINERISIILGLK